MDPLLLGTASAFGLASAAGLNTSLPLLIVGLAARFGLLALAAPYDAIGSDLALIGLAVLATIELVGDKVPALDSVVHAVQWPLAMAAGAILFASQQSIVQDVSPGLAILVGVLTAGGVHTVRALVRPAVNLGTMGLGGPVVSTIEDVLAVTLSLAALLAPLLGLVLAVTLLAVAGRTAAGALRRRRQVNAQS